MCDGIQTIDSNWKLYWLTPQPDGLLEFEQYVGFVFMKVELLLIIAVYNAPYTAPKRHSSKQKIENACLLCVCCYYFVNERVSERASEWMRACLNVNS